MNFSNSSRTSAMIVLVATPLRCSTASTQCSGSARFPKLVADATGLNRSIPLRRDPRPTLRGRPRGMLPRQGYCDTYPREDGAQALP